jgi:hypothetical protein
MLRKITVVKTTGLRVPTFSLTLSHMPTRTCVYTHTHTRQKILFQNSTFDTDAAKPTTILLMYVQCTFYLASVIFIFFPLHVAHVITPKAVKPAHK